MSDAAERRKLQALFAAFTDGTITPEDHAQLEEMLARSPEARRLWFLHCDVETGLANWAAAQQARAAQPPQLPPRSAARWRVWTWGAPLAAAAAVLLLAVLWRSGREERTTRGVAILSRAVGVEWTNPGEAHAIGEALPPGVLRIKSGAALIEFYSGARVVAEGPAEFQLTSANGGFLREGRIAAHVPPQARGFSVGAPGLRVVDHGTDFGVAALPDAPPEVHVFHGRVEIETTGAAPRVLTNGEAVQLQSGAWRGMEADFGAFLTETELVRRDDAEAQRRFAAWREESQTLNSEPDVVLHYAFQEAAPSERTLLNRAAGAPDETHGSIVGAAWTEGRWPDKRALSFRNEGDRVRLSVQRPLEQVTLLAWVRAEALQRGLSSLLSSDDEQTGALRWELTSAGQLRLGIGRELGRPRADWEAVNSEPFLTQERFGRWVLLATTFDGATVRHYGNGQLVGSGAAFHPPALRIGTADLGNWRGKGLRHFRGEIDEFAVFSRALSAKELRALYETGKP